MAVLKEEYIIEPILGGVTKRLPVKVVLSDIEPRDTHVIWIRPMVLPDDSISYEVLINASNKWEVTNFNYLIAKLFANRKTTIYW